MIRIGTGFDVHAFAENRKLILGGVQIPYSHGLAGHSDADVLLHAIMDALLGALALGDIGQHFPDTDPKYKGIDSTQLLRHVYGLVKKKKFILENLDCVVIAQQPKLKPHILAMREVISTLLECDTERISVKATTTEHLGFTGRKEGIAAQCVVLLTSRS